MNEIVAMVMSAKEWLAKSIDSSNCWVIFPCTILSILLSIMFPTDAYICTFFVLVITIILDTFTRIYAELKNNKRMIGVITSAKLWSGISGKLFVLIIVSILLGLLYNISYLSIISLCLFNFIYGILFLREAYSVLENLHDAGHKQVDVFLKIIKGKENQILKDNEIDE